MVIIYLRAYKTRPHDLFISVMKRPYQSLGYLLVGFTAFHQCRFQHCFVTVALSRLLRHSKSLSPFICRYSIRNTLPYFFSKHDHYRHLSLCKLGLSSACLIADRDYQKPTLKLNHSLKAIILIHIIIQLCAKNMTFKIR